MAARAVRGYLQSWDKHASGSENVDLLIANSRFIASQIRAAYGRDAEVVNPFADLTRFSRPRVPGEKLSDGRGVRSQQARRHCE